MQNVHRLYLLYGYDMTPNIKEIGTKMSYITTSVHNLYVLNLNHMAVDYSHMTLRTPDRSLCG